MQRTTTTTMPTTATTTTATTTLVRAVTVEFEPFDFLSSAKTQSTNKKYY